MALVGIKQKGDFNNTDRFLRKMHDCTYIEGILNKYGQRGVDALASLTPKDSGETAASWYYKIGKTKDIYRVEWRNSNINDGIPIALLIQYGHGLPQGGYIQGVDYVNPAMKDIFRGIMTDMWTEVVSA